MQAVVAKSKIQYVSCDEITQKQAICLSRKTIVCQVSKTRTEWNINGEKNQNKEKQIDYNTTPENSDKQVINFRNKLIWDKQTSSVTIRTRQVSRSAINKATDWQNVPRIDGNPPDAITLNQIENKLTKGPQNAKSHKTVLNIQKSHINVLPGIQLCECDSNKRFKVFNQYKEHHKLKYWRSNTDTWSTGNCEAENNNEILKYIK